MTKQVIDIGVQGNDGTGDSIRESFRKVNENFQEIYAVFGIDGSIKLKDLSDGVNYQANQVIMGNTSGSSLSARTLSAGLGISINTSSNSTLTISSSVAGLIGDSVPTLSSPLNANLLTIGRLSDPSQDLVDAFNAIYGTGTINVTTTLDQLAVNKGYADRNYVRVVTTDGVPRLSSALRVRDEPVVPQVNDPDYDSTLSGNYVSSEAIQRKDAVYRGGDTLTGALTLSDHPAPLSGFGSPNGANDLQAATKFYVDNNTFSSSVNLYVSTSSGDDLQQRTPLGKEGRFWQYAYKTVGAAALAAENLQSLASQEPGPYRQKITYTNGPDTYFSTIQSVELTGGNKLVTGYQDAFDLLQLNRSFLQAETIAYINNKYVNKFEYNSTEFSSDIQLLLDAVANDLVLRSTFNVTRAGSKYFNSSSTNALSSQLVQTIEAIAFARDQLINFSYDSQKLEDYITQVITGLCYDLVFQSNYQSIQAGIAFDSASTDLSKDQIVDVLTDLKNNLLGIKATPIISSARVSTTIVGTDNADFVTVESAAGLVVGMPLLGINVGAGAVIISINSSVVPPRIILSVNNAGVINGTGVFGSNAISVIDPSGIDTGQFVTGTGIPADTTVTDIIDNGSNFIILLSSSTSVTVSGTGVFSIDTDINSLLSAETSVSNNISNIISIITTGNLPAVSMPGVATTSVGKTSAKTLLLNNIPFIQAEIIAYLGAEYPNLSYDRDTCKRDIKYIVWSLIYDFMYTGNSQSLYAAYRYWTGSTRNIAAAEVNPILGALDYLNELAQVIILNDPPTTVYQQSVKQYRNETYSGGVAVSTSISDNLGYISSIITNQSSGPAVVYPNTSLASASLQTIRNNTLADIDQYTLDCNLYVTQNFPVINDSQFLTDITNLFQVPINLLTYGIENADFPRQLPVYTSPTGLDSGYGIGRGLLLDNLNFLADETVGWIDDNFNQPPASFTYNIAKFKRNVKYMIEAICYDTTYGGDSASIYSGIAYWENTTSQMSLADQGKIQDAIDYLSSIAQSVASNIAVTTTYSSTPQQFDVAGGSVVVPTIVDSFVVIKDILGDVTLAPTPTNPVFTTAYDPNRIAVSTIINNNKTSISALTIQFLEENFKGGFNYDEAICFRDVGYIIDAMSIDIITGGTWQTVTAGKSYYRNASARAIAIGTQLTETLDAINFTKTLAGQVLNKYNASRYQPLVEQDFGIGLTPAAGAKTTLAANMNTIVSIIRNGFGAAPVPSFGTGIWNVRINNGGNSAVDQGLTGNVDIIPSKVIVGVGDIDNNLPASNAYASIVKYVPNSGSSIDTIQVRLTKPGFFVQGEQIEFGETVKDLHITIFVESGVYYEDYPIKVPPNVSIKGDEFRRTIMRPRDRISQSPWRKVFFYRDAIIDALELGPYDYATDYATDSTITVSGVSNKITFTIGAGQVPASWIGRVVMEDWVNPAKRGRAVIDSVSGNIANCSVIYPFNNSGVKASGTWHVYDTIDYGRFYLTDPLDITSTAKNNKDIDVLLCNDQTRISNMTFQGHGGFAMVLDPEGQIKTKSPYGQVCSSFSQSNNKKRFAGGQFVDGFAGRLFGTIIGVADNGITITVQGELNSGLDVRPPQPPCSFFVQGNRYQINDVVSYDSATATVVLTMDVGTPYNAAGQYNNATCSRDVGLILDAVGYDVVLNSNYQSVKAGNSYSRPDASVVITGQKTQTLAGINKTRDLVLASLSGSTYSGVRNTITERMSIINTIIEQGVSAAPTITYPPSIHTPTNGANVRDNLIANKNFIAAEVAAYIADNYILKNYPGYSTVKSIRDVKYIIDAMIYDLMYDGNSATYDALLAYYGTSIFGEPQTSQLPTTAAMCADAMSHMKTVIQQVITNSVVVETIGNPEAQTITAGLEVIVGSSEYLKLGLLNDLVIDFIADGDWDTVTARETPNINSLNNTLLLARDTIDTSKTTIKNSVITYLNNGGGLVINIEMGGNKSMLANDFAMINDLGYAIVATNGAVTEQVSTFSYYCHTHYWANNGGQIRSVAGSNAHGNYGLRASGFDVTERPDSVNLAYDMVQVAHVYKQGIFKSEMTPTVSKQSLAIFIVGYEYTPFNTSELEIDHTAAGEGISRYEVASIEHTTVTVNGQNVLKLNLSTAGNNGTSAVGLVSTLYDGQTVTIRILQNAKFLNIDNVNPTRPSTALQYIENLGDIYRVLAYNLTESTGELLGPNIAVLQSDASFNYYKFATDLQNIDTVDPDDITKTQGSKVGDNKVAVLEISTQSTIDQINKGIFVVGWAGRTHRVLEYVPPLKIATGNATSSDSNTVYLLNVAGVINVGDIITSSGVGNTGFDGSQTVVSITEPTVNTDPYIVDFFGAATGPINGVVTFGIDRNGWLSLEPNPTTNVVGDGTEIKSLTYVSKTALGTSTTKKAVTFDVSWDKDALPIVDSYYEVSGNSNTLYNGYHQVVSSDSITTITVATNVEDLTVGMVVTCTDPAAVISTGTIIQTIDLGTNSFTAAPACWIPAGAVVSATTVATVSTLTLVNGGTGYFSPPIITFVGGSPIAPALATCKVNSAGTITEVILISPGYGYSSTPTVEIEDIGDGNAEIQAILSAIAEVNPVASAGVSRNRITLAYNTDPGVFGIPSASGTLTFDSKTGTGPYLVQLSGTTGTVTDNKWYKVTGNTNPLYNGFYFCTTSASGTITLRYPYNPGTWDVTTSTTVVLADTKAVSNTLGINKPFDTGTAATLRLGYSAGSAGQITTRISTCRATGHDFLDIGTGSYSTTNYPYQIYGNPAKSKQQSQEVQEDGVGRVFYVTTDQNGIFRVGRFFTVDQGTGTVTFSASIALSNLDGLGFKRGVVVSEFSTDASMTNNAPEIVPVQSAIRGYIDKRLGLDHGGAPMALNTLIGPGFLALSGALGMKGILNMATFRITNVGTPTSPGDGANKSYVDLVASQQDQFSELRDVTFTTPSASQIPVYNSATSKWNNASMTGDITVTWDGTTLTSTIGSQKIVNSMVASNAAILQSKLLMNAASTLASASGIDQAELGLSVFNSSIFTSTNGWITIKNSTNASTGVTLPKIQYISNNSVLGLVNSATASAPIEVSVGDVVSKGDGIKNASFFSAGAITGAAMLVTYDGTNTTNNTYSTVGVTTNGGNNSLVKTLSAGELDVKQYKIDGNKVIDTDGSTTVEFYTPGTHKFASAQGSLISNTSFSIFGTLDVTAAGSSLKSTTLTTGASGTAGTIVGQWSVLSASQIDFSNGTLKSTTLTTGADATTGTIQGNWSLIGTSRLQATYADLAEFYEGDQEYEPGTVLVFGGDKEVTTTTQMNDTRSAGVVTTNPAYVMNSEQTGIKVCLALAGRVPVKVIGRVKKGDMLTTSATAGYAVRATDPKLGSIIGKSLEDKDYGEAGVIQVAVGRV
jgi:hypothetical protein